MSLENKKRDYHEFRCKSGETDIGTAIIVWFDKEEFKLKTGFINLSGDGYFKIYSFKDSEAETPTYYDLQMTAKITWLRIYDDKELIFYKRYDGKTVEILTSGRSIIVKERGE